MRKPCLLACVLVACVCTATANDDIASSNIKEVQSSIAETLRDFRYGREVARERVDTVLGELSSLTVSNGNRSSVELSEAWKQASWLIRETDGSTPLLLEALRTAAALDPENKYLAEELAYESERQAKLRKRIERAAKFRSAGKGENGKQGRGY